MCMQPDECWCRPGWQGADCSECVPYWNCVHGFCEEPYQCICEEGFIGKDCNATQVTDGNWGQWGPWPDCCPENGTQIRTRKCDDPKPAGGGWYCSKDGSKGTEERECPEDTRQCGFMASWGQWTPFGQCSVTCGPGGQQTRTRECSSGNPDDCGDGNDEETQDCNPGPCPIGKNDDLCSSRGSR